MPPKSHYSLPHGSALSLVEAVRKRPGMYVGDTDDESGLHHLVWEILANSIDEVIAGYASDIELSLHSDGSITISDNGRGIPLHDVEGVPFPEAVTTQFHTSASADGHSPHVHVGLSGVGIAPVSALSEWFELETRREGRIKALRTERGVLVQRLRDLGPSSTSGTSIRLRPDSEIFRSTAFSHIIIVERLRELAALTPGLQVILTSNGNSRTYQATNGLASLLSGETAHLAASGDHSRFSFEIVWQWGAPATRIDAFTNWQRVGDPTPAHCPHSVRTQMTKGSHVRGLLSGLGVTDRSEAQKDLGHLHAVLHVRTTDPSMIYGPIGNELRDDELEAAIRQVVREVAKGNDGGRRKAD